MMVHTGMFEGIQLLGDGGVIIVNKIWESLPLGKWSDVQLIPEGHHIIGLRANNFNEVTGVLYQLEFVTGPKPSQF